MKRITLLMALVLSGCAHPYLKSWTENEFTVCCKGLACAPEDLGKFAGDYCPASRVIGGYNDEVASGSTAHYNAFTHQVVSHDDTVKVSCMKYECNRSPAASH